MSDALLWQVLRKDNSKALKRKQPLTGLVIEKGSLRHTRTRADCGFLSKNMVDVSLDDDGVPTLYIRNQNPKYARNPDRTWRRVSLAGGVRKAVSKAQAAINGKVNERTMKYTLAKISVLYQAQLRKNRGVDHSTILAAQQ